MALIGHECKRQTGGTAEVQTTEKQHGQEWTYIRMKLQLHTTMTVSTSITIITI